MVFSKDLAKNDIRGVSPSRWAVLHGRKPGKRQKWEVRKLHCGERGSCDEDECSSESTAVHAGFAKAQYDAGRRKPLGQAGGARPAEISFWVVIWQFAIKSVTRSRDCRQTGACSRYGQRLSRRGRLAEK